MLKKILLNKRIVLIIDIILLIMSINGYKYIYQTEQVKTMFVGEAVRFVEENSNPVFKINKLVLYSSAHAVDNSQDGRMEDIDISQFTDIAIYIDNKGKTEEITAENTINELYIDNLEIKVPSGNGEKILNYKNPKKFGKYTDLNNFQDNRIDFNVVHSNDEQMGAGFADSVFYTDCSNPISLGYINKNILTNCAIGNVNGEVKFDGSILRNASVDLKSISGNIKMSIHIKNNQDEDFICNLELDNTFEDIENGIYSGYVMKIQNTEGEEYHFLKVSK